MKNQSLAGFSILIVEDEPIVLCDIESAFVDAGASISTAVSLEDALQKVEQPDLAAAVLDFGSDGHELCLRLRERGIPFILHSGYGRAGEGCQGGIVIPKPADPQALVEGIVRILR